MKETLDPTPKPDARNDRDKPSVATALQVINDNWTINSDRFSAYERIFDLFQEGWEVAEPNGPRRLSSQLLLQALWKVVGRMKPLDFAVHGIERPELVEKLVADGIGTVMDEGGFVESLRDKAGAFLNMTLLGDAIIQVGANPEGEMPIGFQNSPLSNVYVDQYATKMRGRSGQSVTKMVIIYSYPWAEAIKMYPKLKKVGGAGLIPREKVNLNETNRTYEQQTLIDDNDTVEIAHFYDIANSCYTIFAGAACTVLEEYKGKNYPFVIEGVQYIPAIHLYLQPAMEGFWNYGLGHMLYKLAIIQRQLMNMELYHISENTNPTTLVNLPANQADRFFDDLMAAEEAKAMGKRGYVTIEYDGTGSNQVGVQSLTTQNLYNEWQALWEQLTREISRLGINLDEIDRGSNVTASQVIAEEESANAFVKQTMEYNASEFKFAVEVTMDMIKKFIPKSSKYPINSTTMIPLEGLQEAEIEGIMLGDVADELKKHKYFVRINARSGVYPSNVLQQARITRVLQTLPPGSPAQLKQVMKLAALNDVELLPEDLGIQQGGAPDLAGLEGGEVTETDRIQVNPRQATPQPAI